MTFLVALIMHLKTSCTLLHLQHKFLYILTEINAGLIIHL